MSLNRVCMGIVPDDINGILMPPLVRLMEAHTQRTEHARLLTRSQGIAEKGNQHIPCLHIAWCQGPDQNDHRQGSKGFRDKEPI